MALVIEPAETADVPDLVRLNAEIQAHHAALAPDLYNAKADPDRVCQLFQRQLEDPTQTLLLARHDAVAVGYVWYEMRDAHDGTFTRSGPRAYIHHIGVTGSHRRQGVARRLMNRVIADAGRREVVLTSAAVNAEAHAFFESFGFTSARIIFHRQGTLDP